MTAEVLSEIERTVGSLPAEQGGILGGRPNEGVISHYHFDAEGSRTGVTYSPNAKLLTELLQKEWNPRGIRLMGFVHSHPRGAAPAGGPARSGSILTTSQSSRAAGRLNSAPLSSSGYVTDENEAPEGPRPWS
jgi:hypothetical protein